MRNLLGTIHSLLARCYARLKFPFSTHKRRLRNIEKFHIIVSDLVNASVERLDHNESEIFLLQHKLRQLEQFVSFSQSKLDVKNVLLQFPEVNYLDFENTFRGDEDLIRERQTPYLDYFLGCKNVLDIGCGRGEFLSLLKDNNIKAEGIDIDLDMVTFCQSKQLSVRNVDLFSFLIEVPDNSFDGIFSAQVIEHIDVEKLQKLLYLLYRKSAPGAFVVLETINPICPQGQQYFYMDLTHVKPLFPNVVSFFAQQMGLQKHKLLFRTPVVPNINSVETDETQAHLYGDYALVLKK
jgi:2-polyprenyl-3-methyl-5-hydroxy-6-metoxy-1,4-benzoquinol methylase